MSNPLIDKFYELHPEKKEEPKKQELVEYVKLSEEQMDIVSKYLTTPDKYSTTSVTIPTTTNPNSVGAITAANHIPPPFKTLTSYDTFAGDTSFLDVAGKVQKGDAKVVSMSVSMEHFTKSYTFEVQVYT
jgi:SNF2 family DNA or RNA helicase